MRLADATVTLILLGYVLIPFFFTLIEMSKNQSKLAAGGTAGFHSGIAAALYTLLIFIFAADHKQPSYGMVSVEVVFYFVLPVVAFVANFALVWIFSLMVQAFLPLFRGASFRGSTHGEVDDAFFKNYQFEKPFPEEIPQVGFLDSALSHRLSSPPRPWRAFAEWKSK